MGMCHILMTMIPYTVTWSVNDGATRHKIHLLIANIVYIDYFTIYTLLRAPLRISTMIGGKNELDFVMHTNDNGDGI